MTTSLLPAFYRITPFNTAALKTKPALSPVKLVAGHGQDRRAAFAARHLQQVRPRPPRPLPATWRRRGRGTGSPARWRSAPRSVAFRAQTDRHRPQSRSKPAHIWAKLLGKRSAAPTSRRRGSLGRGKRRGTTRPRRWSVIKRSLGQLGAGERARRSAATAWGRPSSRRPTARACRSRRRPPRGLSASALLPSP